MVLKCCVPMCKGNYDSENKRHIFKFPKATELIEKWVRAIPRKNFVPSKYSAVCHIHFKENDILWKTSEIDGKSGEILTVNLLKPRLSSTAVPSVFPNCPIYLSRNQLDTNRESPDSKKKKLEASALQRAIEQSTSEHASYIEKYSIKCLSELKLKISLIKFNEDWSVIQKSTCVVILYSDVSIASHCIIYIVVDQNLETKVYSKGVELKCLNKYFLKIASITDLESLIQNTESFIKTYSEDDNNVSKKQIILLQLIDEISNMGEDATFDFLKSQICLRTVHKNKRSYSSEFLIICAIFFSISPHAYNFLRSRGLLILPHPNTVKSLCSSLNCDPLIEQNSRYFLQYIRDKHNLFEEKERTITLMMDEIHIKPYIDYKGGNVVGTSSIDSSIANSAYAFMIQSIHSPKKEVVHILPVKVITGTILSTYIKKIIIGLESLSFNVLAVISDNNSINSKAMSYFVSPPQVMLMYPHPSSQEKTLFYMIDSVHIFKCIRNNWINQKNDGLDFVYPDFEDYSVQKIASFKTVRSLFNIEKDELLKYGYGLTLKALWPSSFERQNVQLVCQLFNENISNALLVVGSKQNLHHCEGTAQFIKIITNWWNIVNVKTPLKGICRNNKFQEPITNDRADLRTLFLNKFLKWLDKWNEINLTSGKLTPQTFNAIRQTTEAFIELSKHCFSKLNWSYILPGKFQTDALEARFGQYRQLAGGQYNISVRQVFEIEKKIRLLSSLDLNIANNKKLIINEFDDRDEINADHDYFITPTSFLNSLTVVQNDIDSVRSNETDICVLTYITGYCCYSLLKKNMCQDCQDFLIIDGITCISPQHSLILNLDRGGLKYPKDIPVLVVIYTYIIFKKIVAENNEQIFLNLQNQRRSITQITMAILESVDECNLPNTCEKHESTYLWKKLVYSGINILINNYCKIKNNIPKSSNKNKRKAKIFSVSNS